MPFTVTQVSGGTAGHFDFTAGEQRGVKGWRVGLFGEDSGWRYTQY